MKVGNRQVRKMMVEKNTVIFMKRCNYYFCALLFLFAACEKKIELVGGDLSAFQVSLEKNTYRVGEEVEFKLSGTPGIITCYPGDLYRDYNFKDGRVVEFDNVLLSFASEVGGGVQEFGTGRRYRQ